MSLNGLKGVNCGRRGEEGRKEGENERMMKMIWMINCLLMNIARAVWDAAAQRYDINGYNVVV